MSKLHTPSLTL